MSATPGDLGIFLVRRKDELPSDESSMWPFKRKQTQVLQVDYQAAVRLLGDGYEPHVYQQDGKLIYEFPVDWSFVSIVRSFEIQPVDLAVLIKDADRRAALEVLSHILAQRAMGRGERKFVQADFDRLIAKTLHAPDRDFEKFLDTISRSHHVAVRRFMDDVLERRAGAAAPP